MLLYLRVMVLVLVMVMMQTEPEHPTCTTVLPEVPVLLVPFPAVRLALALAVRTVPFETVTGFAQRYAENVVQVHPKLGMKQAQARLVPKIPAVPATAIMERTMPNTPKTEREGAQLCTPVPRQGAPTPLH